MADTTNISWADSTFNPWLGCTRVSDACKRCYAAAWAKRSGLVQWDNNPRRRTSTQKWKEPRKWQREAAAFQERHGRSRRVFCASLADVFDNKAEAEWRDDLWALIRECDDLIWMLLTKRPQNIAKMLPTFWPQIQDHVWLGTTVENQEEAARRLPALMDIDGCLKFLSCEPLLGHVRLDAVQVGGHLMDYVNAVWYGPRSSPIGEPDGVCQQVDWVLCGGESGPGARPMDPDHARALRDQCRKVGIPFHFKQWGGRTPTAGGHELDGEVIQEFPYR